MWIRTTTVMSLDLPFDYDADDVTLERPPMPLGEQRLRHFAERALQLTEAAVVVALDRAADEARIAVAGHCPNPDGDDEAWLSLWLQVTETTSLCTVPPRLRAILPAEKALVMPLLTPGGLVGAVAISPPCTSRRTLRKLEALAEDLALELELRERQEHASPPPPAVARVA